MATPAIGAQTFDRMIGNPNDPIEQFMVINRPGVDGTALMKLGERGIPFSLITWKGITKSAADSTMTTYRGLVGTTVTITDDSGNTYTNCLILSVERIGVKGIGTSSGISGTGILRAAWQLIGNNT